MIFFPFVYKDELLYSIIARYHQYSGNENFKSTMDDMFGSNNVCVALVLPSHLKSLSQRLPVSDTYSPDYLINNHTLLPYYAPFIPEERYQELKKLMIEGNGISLYMKLGKVATTIKSPKCLKYCTECVKVDRLNNGEAYWHRIHQVEGVNICPNHHTWLIESSIPYFERKNKHESISLEHSIPNEEEALNVKVNNLEFEHLKFIAEQTQYLLNNQIAPFGLENLNKFYVTKLQNQGLTTVSGRIRWIDFIPKFNQYYGEKFLKDLDCYIDINKEDTWLHKLLRKPRVSCHPLRHILLMGFLKETVSTMRSQLNKITYMPFGNGPWYCLNKAADHYRERVITSCVISRDYETGLPVGTFSCSCGFVYSRKGPDKTNEDLYKRGRIKAFGQIWEQRLTELSKMNLSLRKMAVLLGVDPSTVKKKLISVENGTKETNNDTRKENYRNEWIDLININKEKSITEIRALNPKTFTWLYRNDFEWLQNHYPYSKKLKVNSFKRVDWARRDDDVSKKIESIAKEIHAETDELIRVTINEIGRRLGKVAFLYKNLDKMPKTKKTLNEAVESVEQFQIRRIEYMASHLKTTKSNIKEWELIRAAGLKKKDVEKHIKIIKNVVLDN